MSETSPLAVRRELQEKAKRMHADAVANGVDQAQAHAMGMAMDLSAAADDLARAVNAEKEAAERKLRAMKRMRANGASLALIAKVAGMTAGGVKYVLDGKGG